MCVDARGKRVAVGIGAQVGTQPAEEVLVERLVELIPETWLEAPGLRAAYRAYLVDRVKSPRLFVEEAIGGR